MCSAERDKLDEFGNELSGLKHASVHKPYRLQEEQIFTRGVGAQNLGLPVKLQNGTSRVNTVQIRLLPDSLPSVLEISLSIPHKNVRLL